MSGRLDAPNSTPRLLYARVATVLPSHVLVRPCTGRCSELQLSACTSSFLPRTRLPPCTTTADAAVARQSSSLESCTSQVHSPESNTRRPTIQSCMPPPSPTSSCTQPRDLVTQTPASLTSTASLHSMLALTFPESALVVTPIQSGPECHTEPWYSVVTLVLIGHDMADPISQTAKNVLTQTKSSLLHTLD